MPAEKNSTGGFITEPHLGRAPEDERPLFYPPEPETRKSTLGWVVLVIVLVAGGATYYHWRQIPQQAAPAASPQPEAAQPAVTAEPAIRHPIDADATQPLPALDESDTAVRDTLAELLNEKSWMELFYPDRMVRRIVATVDNLPRKKAPLRMMPLKPAPRTFITAASGNATLIGRENSMRYARYVSIAQAVDTKKLVAAYTRFYPLFQRAYEELGYPKGYFNDRLVETIDDMLRAPDIKEPIALEQRKILYEFADPDLEARSAGQKVMMRMGSENAAKVKASLREIRAEITERSPHTNRR